MIFRLDPIFKHYIWGGRYLNQIYDKEEIDNIAEAWTLAVLGDDNSPIIGDEKTLKDYFTQYPDMICDGYDGKFPILVKIINAAEDLSIQNHPSGKTEFWHILSAEKGSYIYLGLKEDMTKDELEKALIEGTITNYLNKIRVSAGDCFFIKPGTIHAIGKGITLAEFQQNMNVTYRLYDFDRIGPDGKKRELHIKEAVECARLEHYAITKMYRNIEGELIRCKFFDIKRHRLYGTERKFVDEHSFHYLLIVDGEGTIRSGRETINLKEGDSIFITARHGNYIISGDVEYLLATL